MKTIEKIKWLNKGIRLGEFCRNLTGDSVGEGAEKRIYAGTEEYVEFFETIISTLGIEANYDIEMVDGELEIVVKGVK
jgi:hypothetical protein